MNILVIGNGFDLYHGLDTNYIDFVRFAEDLIEIKTKETGRKWAINNSFIQCFVKVATENQTWIDCEKEIEIIVTMILKILYDRNVFYKNSNFININESSLNSYEFARLKLMKKFCKEENKGTIEFQNNYFKTYEGIDKTKVMDTLKSDLNDLIKLFKYYLEEKVISQPVMELSEQIENIKPDYVINFNYTSTYKKYGISGEDVCHIHGSVKNDNIVIGIRDVDEKNIDSIYFKKFFQRIQKHTDVIQWDRVGKIRGLTEPRREATTYFFGHSLSKTDGDLIRNIYDNSEKIVVYYMNNPNKKDYEQKVINLIDTLGKDDVIQGMYSGRIAFLPIK